MRLRAVLFSVALVALPQTVKAEWLALGSRSISRADSANPDAPVLGYAYGPRARESLGADIAILLLPSERKTFRLGGAALLALEDADKKRAFPSEIARSWLALSASWAYRWPFFEAFPAELELGVELGRRSAFTLGDYRLSDPYRPNDVPYGAGGYYLGADAAVRFPLAARLQSSARLGLSSYLNALPDAIGQTEASDNTASFLEEGAELSAALELGLRYELSATVQPVAQIYADVIESHDDSARTLWLVRSLIGVALPGQRFELEPYIDAEVGHGQGLLVNRNQLRLGIGARIYAR